MSIPVTPIESGLEFAPTRIDRLSSEVGGFLCDQVCRFKRPYEDKHHMIFGEELSKDERRLKSNPDYIVNPICRCIHESIHATWDRSEPLTNER